MSKEIAERDDSVIEHEPTALAPTSGSPLDLPAEVFKAGLDRRGENRRALMEWVRGALVEGIDFGKIPVRGRKSKPSLWKPGAEKICGMLGCTVTLPTLHEYERAAIAGTAIDSIILRCEIRDARGVVVGNGVGARSVKAEKGDLNKALKMAAKSAHIDATLRMAGLSEVFSQDTEEEAADRKGPSKKQLARLFGIARENSVADEQIRDWLVRHEFTDEDGRGSTKALTDAGYDEIIIWLENQ